MRKRDYMVTTENGNYEWMFNTLREARIKAKELSVEYGYAIVQRWNFEDGDMVIDDCWDIVYENGKEHDKQPKRKKVRL